MSSSPKHLNVGVVLFPIALPLDFVGPTTLFFTLEKNGVLSSDPPSHTLKTIYLGPTLDSIELAGGMFLTPNKTFDEALKAEGEDKLDVILIPGGRGARLGPGNAEARTFEATAEHGVDWIPKARYVHSNKFWTASGVSAGMDMACAWIESLIGAKDTERVQAWAEYTAAGEDDDPWAAKHGL
ncbi:class I glutamine amidotransferase-like protein [Filobasidium floriforme]|uniref:class I glutamine amidotransferase-like protein n=1 Tax=Filobasidium floriforme TaxID=5210 RepID=UPI001E8E9CCE|nr:class I glutamine amidotransferase-like protein [Filobasidium floriforme]KAH8080105.1 class I glutamine amidotransferase-like protein [Filobasidium floriforme]